MILKLTPSSASLSAISRNKEASSLLGVGGTNFESESKIGLSEVRATSGAT